jgi:DNA-binding YbaB/EbfC family protein
MFKGLSNLGGLLKQAQQFGGQMDKLAAEMKNRRATGTAGGGMVEVELNGLLEVLRCRIEPPLFAQGDRELVEDLVVAAMNQAVAKGKQLHAAAVKEMTGGLQLPGLQDVLDKLAGTVEEDPKGGEHA